MKTLVAYRSVLRTRTVSFLSAVSLLSLCRYVQRCWIACSRFARSIARLPNSPVMSTFRRLSVVLVLAFTILCLPQRLIADAPETLVSDYVDGLSLTLQGTNLYWKTDCGDDFSPANSRMRSIATNRMAGGDLSAESIAHTLFLSSNRCEEGPTRDRAGDRIASMNVAVDAMYVYWVSGNGVVVRLSRNAMPGEPPTVLALTESTRIARYPNVPSIAVDDRFVYWSEVNKMFRAPKDGGDPRLLFAGGTMISNLRPGGDGTVYYLDGSRLWVMAYDPVHDVYLPTNLAEGVAAYALGSERFYWASRGSGAYVIASKRRDRSDYRVHFESSAAEVNEHPNQSVDILALDSVNLYWHLVIDRSGGPIVRLPLSGGPPAPISDSYQLLNTAMVSDGAYLLWADYNSHAIYRLPIGAAASRPGSVLRPVFQVTDVSPDRSFGAPGGGPATGGRIMNVVVDPRSAGFVYAAGEFSGVWKSTNAARTWFQSSAGLTTGRSRASGLAVDAVNPQRLMYATIDTDFRQVSPAGGLWTSTDGAGSWRHVDLPGCSPSPNAYSVAFTAGHAFVITRCGVYTSTDLINWVGLSSPSAINPISWLAARGDTLFVATNNDKVYRSTIGDLFLPGGRLRTDGMPWSAAIGLPGTIFGLAVAPTNSAREPAVLVLHASVSGQVAQVSLANFDLAPDASQLRSLGLNRAGYCCGGTLAIFAAHRASARIGDVTPGSGFDIFVTDAHDFFQYQSPDNWPLLDGMHVDPWGMAFPSNYDPDTGDCTAYVANDGGIYTNTFATQAAHSPTCTTSAGPWGRAQFGLHALASYTMAGIHQPPCAGGQPCAALYVPSADNASWTSPSGGIPGLAWNQFGYAGDTGMCYVDPLLPGQVTTNRYVHRSTDPLNSPIGWDTPYVTDMGAVPGIVNGAGDSNSSQVPPQAPGFTQVMTLPGTAISNQGDYIGIQQTGPTDSLTERIVRNLNSRDWVDLSPGFSFPANTIQALAASGGHRSLVVYLVKTDGTILKGKAVSSGLVPSTSWENISAGIRRAINISADPYHQDVLYVTDSAAQEILSSHVAPDGQVRWTREPELKRIATNNGEFAFGCGDKSCPLQQVLFSDKAPEMRVAILFPGGVAFSRDSGRHWIPITDQLSGLGQLTNVRQLSDLIAHPYSGFFDADADPHRGHSSLYLALRGRGIVRLDGPFATVEQLEFEFDPQRRLAHAGRSPEKAVAINESTGVITELHPGTDGIYRGTEILDAAGYATIRYRIVADSGTRSFSHALTPAERASGIASLRLTAESPAEAKITIAKVSATPRALGYGSCGKLPAVITVQAYLNASPQKDQGTPSSAVVDPGPVVLRYRYASDSKSLKPGSWRERVMKDAGANSYVIAFDVSGEAAEVLQKANGAIEYQIVLGDGKTSSAMEEVEIRYCSEAAKEHTKEPPRSAPRSPAESAAEFQVTGVSLKAEREKFIGPCPAVLKFLGSVTVNAPGTVRYSFVRSDAAVGPVETLYFDSAGTKTVGTVWTLGGPDLTTYDGWQAIRILSPNVMESDKALFAFRCEKSE